MSPPKIGLICSAGGHFLELYALRDAWKECDRFWVTFPAPDTEHLLSCERVYPAHHPTNRHLPNLVRNLGLARQVLRTEKPDLLISTGAGVSVPFLWLGRTMGIPTVYIESVTLSESISLTGRLVYFTVSDFLVQWPSLSRLYRRTKYVGRVL
jgi:UDP-N-acetylglucosamine:LPS N-acetylglucosamine transferase